MWTEIVVFDLSFEDYENENDSADCPSGKLLKICEMERIPRKRERALNSLNASLEWEVFPIFDALFWAAGADGQYIDGKWMNLTDVHATFSLLAQLLHWNKWKSSPEKLLSYSEFFPVALSVGMNLWGIREK